MEDVNTGEIPEQKPRVLFICTHNSARSQMAEGYLRARYSDLFDAGSAGTEARGYIRQRLRSWERSVSTYRASAPD